MATRINSPPGRRPRRLRVPRRTKLRRATPLRDGRLRRGSALEFGMFDPPRIAECAEFSATVRCEYPFHAFPCGCKGMRANV